MAVACPGLTPAACLGTPIGAAVGLLGGRGRLMRAMAGEDKGGGHPARGQGQATSEYTRPDGTRVMSFNGIEGIRAFCEMQNAMRRK